MRILTQCFKQMQYFCRKQVINKLKIVYIWGLYSLLYLNPFYLELNIYSLAHPSLLRGTVCACTISGTEHS